MTGSTAALLKIEPDLPPSRPDDFTREIYGFLGVPVDVTSMRSVVHGIETAAANATPLFISTTNVNFVANSWRDAEFRDSLMHSDLCTPDGMTIVWLGRLLGIPVKERVAGADLFDVLKYADTHTPLKVFLFGGLKGVAALAEAKINAEGGGVVCTGSHFPGFGSVDEMSTDEIIEKINASNADILALALGAAKAHLWLERNRDRVKVPVVAHFGATINFQAGTTRRAPVRLRKIGLEWLWRVKEEPKLWRRYAADGWVLLRLLITHVLPLLILQQWCRLRWRRDPGIRIEKAEGRNMVVLAISGLAIKKNLEKAAPHLQTAATAAKDVVINFAGTRQIDARFIGSLLVLDKQLKERQCRMKLTAVPRTVERLFRLNGFSFLL